MSSDDAQFAAQVSEQVSEQVAETTRRLYELGWMRGTSGNVSAVESDDPRVLSVSSSGIAKHSMAAQHAVRTDYRGAALAGQALRPSPTAHREESGA